MKKALAWAACTAVLGFAGCSNNTSIAQRSPSTETDAIAVDLALDETVDFAGTENEPSEPAKVKYVMQAKKWGTLRAKFVLDGSPKEVAKINVVQDPICAQFPITSEVMLVSKDGGIRNMVVYMDSKSAVKDIHPDLAKPSKDEVVLDNKACVFAPHILPVRVGQTVKVTNSDTTGHNANFTLFNNKSVNFLVPGGGSKSTEKFEQDEPAPTPVDCNIHPWMKAHLIVQAHPYIGVSGEDGTLEIEKLPVGKVTFKVWHESQSGALDDVNVAGKKQKWARGKVEIEIKEGLNDLGVVKIPTSEFK